MFYCLIFISFFFAFSSKNWFMVWVSFEINMMSFIPLIYNNSSLSISSMMKYFIIQSTGSSLFFFISSLNSFFNFSIINFITLPLLLKLGIFPFHFWVMEICEGLNFLNLFILLSLQKFIPLYIINLNFNYWIFLILAINSMICSSMMFFQTSIRKILVLSSLTHISWMIVCMIFNDSTWLFYVCIYILIMLPMFLTLSNYKINSIFQFKFMNSFTVCIFFFNFLSIAGVPPFLGFYLKWCILSKFSELNMIQFMLIFSSILNSYIYIRLITPFFLTNQLATPHNKMMINIMWIFNLIILLLIPMILF